MTRSIPRGRPPTTYPGEIESFMREYFARNDQLPGTKAIADRFGWASANAAQHHIVRMVKSGFIEKNEAGRYRFTRSKKNDSADR